MWKIIEDLKTLEIKATHHKEILDEIYKDLETIKYEMIGWNLQETKEEIQKIMDKLEDM